MHTPPDHGASGPTANPPGPGPAAPGGAAAGNAHRLPRTVEPRFYRLTLTPDLPAAAFTGEVGIDVDVLEPVREIVLNAAELTVASAEVTLPDGARRSPGAITLDEESERLTLTFAETLPAGPAVLSLDFAGMLNDRLHGFYRSTFTDDEGNEHVIATTQMEATDARRAFPCWDEPDRKAVFEVTLVVDERLAAFSNGPVVAEEPAGPGSGRRIVRFAPTMPMSTYLVAFVVGPLDATGPVDVDGVPLRIVHPPGKGHLTAYALEVGTHALRFFTDYFGIAYPAEKLDLVAIPDFAFGAMENLGCVTFRESLLLVDPEQASRVELERVADVISHEIAHMWFGDLVTMKWWNGIWLNEAFATFMEVLCVDAFRPEWQRWVSFGTEREAAMATDGLWATRPVEYPVGRPEEAQGMFDVLTYQKGGSVLRMLERFMGAEQFRSGIRDYLTAHAHGNTDTDDLWDALERAEGEPVAVRTIMDTWINQGGHPLVRVGADGTLTQQPFSYQATPGGAIGDAWQVPVLVRPLADPAATPDRLLLAPATAGGAAGAGAAGTASVPEGSLVNAGGWGFYRVAYPSERTASLAGSLGDLTPLERCNVLSDSWAAALSGAAPLEDFLRLGSALAATDEDHPSVWSVVIGALGLFDRAVPDGARPDLHGAIAALIGPPCARLGWDPRPDDTERTPSLRAMLLGTLGTLGSDAAVRVEATARFEEDRAGRQPLDPETATAVLSIVADTGAAGEFETFLDRYRTAATPQEENRYLYALAGFADTGLAERAFDLALTEVRTQNAPFLIQSLLANRATGPLVWGHVKERWQELVDRFPANILPRMLDGVRGLCRDRATSDDVHAFLATHALASGGRTVDQALERLSVNVAFVEREGERIVGQLAALQIGA